MEMQIQDLVSAIKKDGVDAAKKEAEQIIAEAKSTADAIVSKAKEEAEAIVKKAERDIETMKESANTSVEHAKRDAILFFEKSVQTEFQKLLGADISRSVDEQTLVKLIVAAINGEDASSYIAEVAEVTEGLKGELAQKISAGLEIKASPNVRKGFRLAQKDGSGYFDCSDEELEKMLLPYFPEITF